MILGLILGYKIPELIKGLIGRRRHFLLVSIGYDLFYPSVSGWLTLVPNTYPLAGIYWSSPFYFYLNEIDVLENIFPIALILSQLYIYHL